MWQTVGIVSTPKTYVETKIIKKKFIDIKKCTSAKKKIRKQKITGSLTPECSSLSPLIAHSIVLLYTLLGFSFFLLNR